MAVSMNGINGSDYSAYLNQSQSVGLTNQISNMKPQNASDAEMMEACKQFEAYMVEQIYKQMKSTIKSDEDENQYMSYFGDLQVQEYAKMVSDQGSLGLAQQLYNSMKLQNSGLSIEELHMQEEARAQAEQKVKEQIAAGKTPENQKNNTTETSDEVKGVESV